MILMSWKQIACHLNCAVRTAQRWERDGLPVARPFPGRRSYVTADAEMLESWVRDGVFRQNQHFDRLKEVQRSRKLRAEARHSREILRKNMLLLSGRAAYLRHGFELLHARQQKSLRKAGGLSQGG